MINNKSYNLILRKLKSYSLSISNYKLGVGISVIIKNLFIRINSTMSLIMNSTTAVKLKISIVSMNVLIQNFSVNVAKISPKIVATSQALLNSNSVVKMLVRVVSNLSQIQNVLTTVHLAIRTQGTALLGSFYVLGDWDTSTLGTMDANTLGNTDFHV